MIVGMKMPIDTANMEEIRLSGTGISIWDSSCSRIVVISRTAWFAIDRRSIDSPQNYLVSVSLSYITTLIMLRVTILLHVYYFFEVDYSVHVEMYI